MKKYLPVDLIERSGEWFVVCFRVTPFKPSKPFLVDDLYARFEALFSNAIEDSNTAFVRRMFYSNAADVEYFSIKDFITEFGHSSTKKKLGFVFHMSRCGSTLFSNLLRLESHTVAISEPTIINAILDPAKNLSRDTLVNLVASSITALSEFFEEENVIVKFRSWNVLFLREILSLFQGTPALFIHRNGLEILDSNLEKPSGWLRARKRYAAFFSKFTDLTPDELMEVEDSEYVLHILSSFINQVLKAEPEIIALDYQNLKGSYFPLVQKIFNIHYTEVERASALESMATYSKGAGEFIEDSERKRLKYGQKYIDLNTELVEKRRLLLHSLVGI